ncbi:MAG: gamma-glutamyltransferase [Pseudomonadaceae bacterium]|nr:MAG: gamma-glutamyltransferase [Pseudomonadaceae bacterium]
MLQGLLLSLLLGLSLTLQAAPERHAIATAHPIATAAAEQTLEAGGNAIDAAIAASATLGVVEPYGSGLGGGGFYLLRLVEDDGSTRHVFVDARETAPLKAHPDLYRDEDGEVQRAPSVNGALAAGIPGLPAALVHLAEHYGKLPLSQSLAPAITAAEHGFAVTTRYQALGGFRLEAMRDDPETARLFLRDNEIPTEGTLIQQPELAETLRQLAANGRAGFYQGPVAEQLLSGVQAAGGIWQQADFDQYQIIEREPVSFMLGDTRVISSPLPSAGGIALAQILQGQQQLPAAEYASTAWVHQLTELMRRSYRDRAVLLGDSDFIEVPVEHLISADYAAQLAAQIDPKQATSSASLGEPELISEGDNTTHFSLLDAQGNGVAATLSINLPFGAALTIPGTGVILNNEMDDFAADIHGVNEYGLAGGKANAVEAGKRPLSSMTPTILDGPDQLMLIGTPGGSRIITMVLLGIEAARQGDSAEQIVSRPRFHHQYLPDRIQHEAGTFDADERKALEQLGHELYEVGRDYGDMQLVIWHKGSNQLEAASDPRGVGKSRVQAAP